MAPQKGGHAVCRRKLKTRETPITDQPSGEPATTPDVDDTTCTIDDIKAKYKRSLDRINNRLLSLNIDGEFEFLLVKKQEKSGGAKRRRCVKKGGSPKKYILRCFGVYKDNRVRPVAGQSSPSPVKINNFVHDVIEPVRRLDRRLKTTEFSVKFEQYINSLQTQIDAKKTELANKELIIYIVNLLFKIRDPDVQIQFHTITGTGTIRYDTDKVFVVISDIKYVLEGSVYMADNYMSDIDNAITAIPFDNPIVQLKDGTAHVTATNEVIVQPLKDEIADVFTIDGIKVSVNSEDTTLLQQATQLQQATLTQQTSVLKLPEATSAQHEVIYGLICPEIK